MKILMCKFNFFFEKKSSMSTNQLTIEKRQQEKKIIKTGGQAVEVDLPKRNVGFNPQKAKISDELHDSEQTIRASHQIEMRKTLKKNLFDQNYPVKTNSTQEIEIPKPREEKKNQNQEKEPLKIEKTVYTVEELKRAAPSGNSNSSHVPTRGYILLKNYVKEMHDCGNVSSFNSKNYQMMKKLQNNNATLLASGMDSFVPTILKKNVGEWDENSELAFEMDTKTILNRLTPQNIDESISELLSKIGNDEKRIEFMINSLVRKASSEKSFSNVYADFVKHLSYEDDDEAIADRIIQYAEEYFDNNILNASSDYTDSDSEIYIGCATFIGSLIKNGAFDNGEFYLSQIIDYLPVEERKPLNTHIIEMLYNFIKSVGDDFIEENRELLKRVDEILKNRKNIKSLHRFILIDTLEIINSAINNNDNIDNYNGQDNEQKDNRNLDELKSICRNGYASYQEDYYVVPACVADMKSMDFLEGTMQLFQDMKNVYDFTYYQCFVLQSLEFQSKDIVNMLIKYVKIFTEQEVVREKPLIWKNYNQILLQMIIQNIITIEDAKLIQSHIFEQNKKEFRGKDAINDYDPLNDLKFFIDNNLDFSEPYEFDSPNYPSEEINLTLRLPKIIDDTDLNIPRFTKIITVGVIRSIFYKFANESEDQTVNGLQKWKNLLAEAHLKEPKVFSNEVRYQIDNYGLEIQYDDVVQFLS